MTIRAAKTHPGDVPPEPLLDHLVYGVPDLARAIDEFRDATGIDPAPGGRHQGAGTRNYLVGLGPTSYLEIIGPDPDNPPEPGRRMPFGVQGLTAPRLVTWAVHPADIDRAARASAEAGADLGAVEPMQRVRPDGLLLSWRLIAPQPPPFAGVTPFLIDWGDSPHPATSGLPPARLRSLTGSHPDPSAVAAVLDALTVRLPVADGPAGLIAVIDTPRGTVELR